MAASRRGPLLRTIAMGAGVLVVLAVAAYTLVDVVTATNTRALERTAAVSERGFAFVPRVVSIVPGRTTAVAVANDSFQHHTFTVPALGIDVVLAPGQDAEVRIPPGRWRSIQFFCRFHQARGMKGVLVVGGTSRGEVPRAG
jgi:plastocyanin